MKQEDAAAIGQAGDSLYRSGIPVSVVTSKKSTLVGGSTGDNQLQPLHDKMRPNSSGNLSLRRLLLWDADSIFEKFMLFVSTFSFRFFNLGNW